MTFEEFLFEIMIVINGYGVEWRIGQTVMNVLRQIRIDKYNEITGTEYDCFYTNSVVPKTLKKLKEEWDVN